MVFVLLLLGFIQGGLLLAPSTMLTPPSLLVEEGVTARFLSGDATAVSMLLPSSVWVSMWIVELDPKLTRDRLRLVPPVVRAIPSARFGGGFCFDSCGCGGGGTMVICAIDNSRSTGTSMDDSTRKGGVFPDDEDGVDDDLDLNVGVDFNGALVDAAIDGAVTPSPAAAPTALGDGIVALLLQVRSLLPVVRESPLKCVC